MRKIVTKTIKIKSDKMPPQMAFIENYFKKENLDVVRWAIVDVIDKEIILSVSFFN